MNPTPHINNTNRFLHAQSGMGLIEVLVSIILLSSVLLGAIGLQLSTAKEQRSAQFVGRAALLASEIDERMRANRAAIELNANLYTTVLNYGTVNNQMNSPSTYSCITQACNATEIADYDKSIWWQSIRNQMPADTVGILAISGDAANLLSRDIVIIWREPVVNKNASGNPNILTGTNNGCPSSILNVPNGMRCYIQRATL